MKKPGKTDRFQERLDRIQSEREHDRQSLPEVRNAPVDRMAVKKQPRMKKSSPNAPLVKAAALVAVTVVAIVGAGAFAVSKVNASVDLPLRQMALDFISDAVAVTPTSRTYDGLLDSGPKNLKLNDVGWEIPASMVAAAGRQDITLAQIAVASADAQPVQGSVVPFSNNSSCTLRAPRAGEVVRNVRLNNTAKYTHAHLFSKAELAKAVGDRIEGITRDPKHYKNAAIPKGRMGQVDVYVTDTSGPVYLVLQTFNRDVLWNVHLAPDATLAHVAIIGNKSGFAAPQGDYTYEAIRIEDFVEEDKMWDNSEMRTCMVVPWRKAEADWPLLQKQNDGRDASTYRNQLKGIVQGFAAYNRWYMSQLGVDADHNLTAAFSAAHVLSGQPPAMPITTRSIEQRKLHVAQSDYIAFGDAQLEQLHNDLLLTATDGDLSILKTSKMVRATQ